jgi:hypothetical protein
VAPLDWHDWKLVLYFSIPVIFVDEILKFYGRLMTNRELKRSGKALN